MYYLDSFSLISADEDFADVGLYINEQPIPFTLKQKRLLEFVAAEEDLGALVLKVGGKRADLVLRKVVYEPSFERIFLPDIASLGCFPCEGGWLLRTVVPLATEVFAVVDGKSYAMNRRANCFELFLADDLAGCRYHYAFFRHGHLVCFNDPFALYSDDESYLLTLPEAERVKMPVCHQPFIYELSVRDFSSSHFYNGDFKGKMLALCQEGLEYLGQKIGLDYLKELGVTHLQLMPVLNFDNDGYDYNWGYNPLNYNGFKQSYFVTQRPYEEFRQVVAFLHQCGLRVILDVVFNHVYKSSLFDLAKMLPHYCFRYLDDKEADGSFCGNEIRSEAPFMRAYIKMICRRLVRFYDIDGLRFDLMGLLDVRTMQELRDELRMMKEDFLLYGEGWDMGEVLPAAKKADLANAHKLPTIAFFDPYLRDAVKDFCCGRSSVRELALALSSQNLRAEQAIRYVECHDGLTFYDFLRKSYDDEELIRKFSKLALSLVLMSKGIPFIQAGQEFLRSKGGVANSYKSEDFVNNIDWSKLFLNADLAEYCRWLIAFRKQYWQYWQKELEVAVEGELLICHLGDMVLFYNLGKQECVYRQKVLYSLAIDGRNSDHLILLPFSLTIAFENNII